MVLHSLLLVSVVFLRNLEYNNYNNYNKYNKYCNYCIIVISVIIVIIVNMIMAGENNSSADYNGDGEVNILDIVAIVQVILSN